MQALQFDRHGGPEVLGIADVPEPVPGPGQVRIAMQAASVNVFDTKLRAGRMGGDLPGGVGVDGAGVVDQVGDGVSEVALGLEVFGLGQRTAAEFAVLDTYTTKPVQMSWIEAAASGTAGETAHRGLGLLGLGSGNTVVIDGAAGGVGVFAVQIAVARGLQVIATASPANHAFLAGLGATPVTYGDGLADRIRALTGDGVHGVLDVVGKSPIEVLTGLVDDPTQVVSIANFDAAAAGARVTSSLSDGDPQAALEEVAGLYTGGSLQIPVQAVFPLGEGAAAHRLSETGHVRGKLVLTVP